MQSDSVIDILHDLFTGVPLKNVHSAQIHGKHDLVMLMLLEWFKEMYSSTDLAI